MAAVTGVDVGVSSRLRVGSNECGFRSVGASFGDVEKADAEVADSEKEKDAFDGAGDEPSELGDHNGIGGGGVEKVMVASL